ncbi:MAG TPA: ribonuclease D [Alphaproteobacteria bacterium]|nr:ribonuclease D [Alphaproteobacteria bacterium]
MNLITDSEALARFCTDQTSADFIAVDTEFLRDQTYWPKLCLVQVAGPDSVAAIDPLAPGIDLTPLYELMQATDLLKVFHAGRQDLEIFFHATGKVPTPIFDTQVAAMVCGFGESASYESLVNKLAKAAVDKSSRFTDWSYRPLTERQLIYALDDVIHLRTVYAKIKDQLERTGREHWLEGDMAILSDPGIYRLDPGDSWRRLKLRNPKPRTLAALKAIAAWREIEAQKRDLPRGRILRDEAVIELASHLPTTAAQLGRTRGLPGGFADGKWGAAVLEAIETVMALPQDDLPKPEPTAETPGNLGSTVELLKVLLKHKAEKNGVAARLLATTDELERIAAGHDLTGWRYELFGADAAALRDGKLTLGLEHGRVKIFPVA